MTNIIQDIMAAVTPTFFVIATITSIRKSCINKKTSIFYSSMLLIQRNTTAAKYSSLLGQIQII